MGAVIRVWRDRPLESALRAENAKLREALEKIAKHEQSHLTRLRNFQDDIDAMKLIAQEALKNE